MLDEQLIWHLGFAHSFVIGYFVIRYFRYGFDNLDNDRS